ncbi:MAG: glycerol-3-phosphate 1-O-acyltransferase PlsY [Thermoleophilia bacterium]
MIEAVLIVAAYLVGSLSPSVMLGRLVRGVDVRHHGSGNAGATNAFRVLGVKLGTAVLLLDVVKGFVPVAVAGLFVSPTVIVLVGVAAMAGHNWSLFLRGRGGKGVATGAGVLLAVMPLTLAVLVLLFVVVLLSTSLVSLSSLTAAVALPVLAVLAGKPYPYQVFSLVAAAVVVYAHRGNIRRLLRREEPRSGLSWVSVGGWFRSRKGGHEEEGGA